MALEIPLIFVKFRGKDKTSISQRSDYGNQSILLGYQKLKDRLISENICITDTSVRPRKDIYLYDNDCINEILINMIVHNDWTITEPLVSFYSDRIEFTSHGGLPNGLSAEDFYRGVSCPRNQVLMRIFLNLGIVEHTGHGVPLIIKKYGKDVFDIHENYINVIIPFDRRVMKSINNFDVAGTNGGTNFGTVKNLTDKSKTTLLELIKNPKISYDELSIQTKIPRRTISRILDDLKNKGFIERVGNNKSGFWKIIG